MGEDIEIHYGEKYIKIEAPAIRGKTAATIIHNFEKVKFTHL